MNGKPKILIVGDDEPSTMPLRGELEAEGYEVYWVPDGRQAKAKLELADFSLMIAHSVRLPDGDAANLITEVCRSRATEHPMHIVVITAGDTKSPDFTKKYTEAGADDIIQKPYEVDDVLTAVRDFLTVS